MNSAWRSRGSRRPSSAAEPGVAGRLIAIPDRLALAKGRANATFQANNEPAGLNPHGVFPVMTRRNLLIGASAIAIVAALAGADALLAARPAAAQGAAADILVPPPLGDRVLGKDDAPVTIVEYASMT